MKFHKLTRRLISTSCLSLLIVWQAFAASPIQQPSSITTEQAPTIEIATAQDAAVTPAGCCDAGCCDTGCGNGGCYNGNCCCDAVCCPKKVTEEVKKHCWKVKPELVCIPGFRFECNWGKSKCYKNKGCCDCGDTCCSSGSRSCNDPGKPTCGRVRCINVLEKHEYTCEECGYEWSVKCVRSSKGGCCRGGGNSCPSCGCSGCCASTDEKTTDLQLTSAIYATAIEAAATDEPVAEKASLSRRIMSWLK